MKRQALWYLFGALALCACVGRVDASVLYSASQLVQGTQASATPLQIPGAGQLSLTLTDMQFPKPFTSLTFTISDAQMVLVGPAKPQTLTLDLTGPATLYADVFATAQGSAGLYSLTASFLSETSVPLPASGTLLAGALLLAGAMLLASPPGLGWRARATASPRLA